MKLNHLLSSFFHFTTRDEVVFNFGGFSYEYNFRLT